jgi:cytochrome bd-type quinol oxidase subunit 2
VKFKGILPTAIAIASGVLVLFGYFLRTPFLNLIRIELLQWAVILAAFAILVGIGNLLLVHSSKVRRQQKGSFYSVLLILAMLVTLAVGFLPLPQRTDGLSLLFNAIQLPIEASLMALLAVTLTYAGIRLLRRRLNLLSIIFLATVMLILLGSAPLPFIGEILKINGVPLLSGILRPWIAQVLAAGGARGILIGVALGTLTTGLRILFGSDRPYGGNQS